MQSIVITKGVTLGLVVGIFTYLMYFIDPSLILQWWMGIIPILFYLYFMVTAVNAFKAQNEGFASFSEALLSSWFTGLIGGFIAMLFTYVLYNFIDPSLIDMINEKSLEMVEKFAGSLDEEAYDEMVENMENQNSFSIGNQLIGFIVMGIAGLIVSLVIAAITKNEKDEWA